MRPCGHDWIYQSKSHLPGVCGNEEKSMDGEKPYFTHLGELAFDAPQAGWRDDFAGGLKS